MSNDFKIEDFINKVPCGIYALDKNGKISYWNDEMIKITGFNNDDVLNKKVDIINLYQDKDERSKLDHIKCLNEKDRMQNIIYIKDKDNKYKQIFIKARKIENDKIRAIVSVADFSEIIFCGFLQETDESDVFHNIVGKDKSMKEIYKMIELAAESLSNVLITGESGTGKELIAKAIHDLSDRKDKPFIIVNCSSLSENLLESELFGHVKGSFTGAYKDKIGKFEASHEGTIFLDEIGDISPLIQVKLLRVIQEKTITRVGDNNEIKVDMRIITATNKNLRKIVNEGLFREDLFYRLNVFPIHTVPLRIRENDIPLLCRHFINKFNKKTGKSIKDFTGDAMRLLMDYCWPGNVRELENCIEHAFVVCKNDLIDVFDLPQELRIVNLRNRICDESVIINNELKNNHNNEVMINKKDITKEELIELLNANKWNKTKTANELGISRVALWKKLKKFEIK